jgi:hypothetical protein
MCRPTDQITVWHDGPGRTVIPIDAETAAIRTSLDGERLVVRGFKLGETFP